MIEAWMRVECPGCGAGFRVVRDAVPAEGAEAVCRKCGSRFSVARPSAGGAEAARPAPDAGPVEKSADGRYACPRCGHRQTQPNNCYACGAVITPKDPAVPANPVPARDAVAPKPGLPFETAMGEIVVRMRFGMTDWLLNFAKPRVDIDGMEHHPGWGVHAFRVPGGDCTVAADYRYFFMHQGRGAVTVRLAPAEKVYLDYLPRAASVSSPGTLRKAPVAEGLLWRVQAGSGKPAEKGLYSRKAVIISLAVMGPLGLFQLWKSDAFPTPVKWAITALVALELYWILSKLSIPTGSLLLQ